MSFLPKQTSIGFVAKKKGSSRNCCFVGLFVHAGRFVCSGEEKFLYQTPFLFLVAKTNSARGSVRVSLGLKPLFFRLKNELIGHLLDFLSLSPLVPQLVLYVRNLGPDM